MWYGTDTKEILEAKEKYESIFGYNPDDEITLEYGADEGDDYLQDILYAIDHHINIADIYPDEDADW